MPKQLVCQNRETAVGPLSSSPSAMVEGTKDHLGSGSNSITKNANCFSTLQQENKPTSNSTVSKPAPPSHRLGSFAFQPYQLFSPTPYAAKKISADGDVVSNGSTHSTKSSDSKEPPINLTTNKNASVDRMVIDDEMMVTRQHKPFSPPPTVQPAKPTVQKNSCQPTLVPPPISSSRSSGTTTHLGSTPQSINNDSTHPQIKLPPTSMYPYNTTAKYQPLNGTNASTNSGISPPTHVVQPLPPLPSISSMRSLVGLSPKVQKQGFTSPKSKVKKGLTSPSLSAHLTTNNFSAVVNSGSTKSFGSAVSTTQTFYASPMKSVDNSNPYTISSLTTTVTTQNENVNNANIMNNNTANTNQTQTAEKKEAPAKPIPKLPFGTLSLMN